MSVPQYGLASAEVSPHKFWFFGNQNTASEVYFNGSIVPGPTMPETFSFACIARIDDARTFVASTNNRNGYIYDWSTGSFKTYPNLLLAKSAYQSKCGLATVPFSGRKFIAVVGGDDYGKKVQDIELAADMKSFGGVDLTDTFEFATVVPYKNTFLLVGGGTDRTKIGEYYPAEAEVDPRPERLAHEVGLSFAAFVGEGQVTCNQGMRTFNERWTLRFKF